MKTAPGKHNFLKITQLITNFSCLYSLKAAVGNFIHETKQLHAAMK